MYFFCKDCRMMWPTIPTTEPVPNPKRPLIHMTRRTSATVRISSWESVSGGVKARDMRWNQLQWRVTTMQADRTIRWRFLAEMLFMQSKIYSVAFTYYHGAWCFWRWSAPAVAVRSYHGAKQRSRHNKWLIIRRLLSSFIIDRTWISMNPFPR